MVFPEHMEFRYYITPERKECFALYNKTLGSRMTYLDQAQDLGQCLIDPLLSFFGTRMWG